jgi:hypothetical protein
LIASSRLSRKIIVVSVRYYTATRHQFLSARQKDFEGEHMIIYKNINESKESKGSDFFIKNVLDKAGVSPLRIRKMQLTEGRVELVKAGIGITVLSRWLVKPFLGKKSSIKKIRIGKNGYYRSWFLATLSHKKNEAHIQSFATFLKGRHRSVHDK